ncbi:hypothetical protein LSH36_362g02000 [Paralvinella palmiformis]|uniref:T-cell immunomodulatory protein TIP C2 domain-containing protein n=1 Tax=Paralvinella palmiformis TaxID=53620 RepID=A0AAD9JEY0_9ANNE|nr:hypothetical protein LSH36_362g02000 [Paralvinella palmiformis]
MIWKSPTIFLTRCRLCILYLYLVICTANAVDISSSLSSALGGVSSLFEYKTSELLQGKDGGIVAAFGDINGDQYVDIFVITDNSRQVDVLLAQENKLYTRVPLIGVTSGIITSVVPVDFNGDVQMDVMLVTREVNNKNGPYNISIFWGNNSDTVLNHPLVLPETFLDEPLVFDFNGDMYPDLLAEVTAGVRKVWLFHHNESFTVIDFPTKPGQNATPFAFPQSHAFIDLNADLIPDLALTTQTGYELWLNVDGVFVFNTSYNFPQTFSDGYIGLSSFADLDQDNIIEHILPGCVDKDCTKCAVMIRYQDQWLQIMKPTDMTVDGSSWGFIPPELSRYVDHTNQSFPVTLRMADYDLDGYPDAVTVLKNASDPGNQQVFVLDNIPCEGETCVFPRSFKLHFTDHGQNSNAMVATFYDIYEDGTPDVVMVMMSHNLVKDTYSPHIMLLKNDIAMHSCFVKVTVTSGLCYKNCPSGNVPYGVNYPGAVVYYKTMKTDRTPQQSAGTQLSQTAHFSLQTPYQTFGLGETPNIIDEFSVGIPHPQNTAKRDRSWTFIIPNSQLTVIPHPPSNPTKWLLKLYITPSQLVYVTGAALLGTCGFIAGIVGILHWREKREDKLEKKQESHRFHFDAM